MFLQVFDVSCALVCIILCLSYLWCGVTYLSEVKRREPPSTIAFMECAFDDANEVQLVLAVKCIPHNRN